MKETQVRVQAHTEDLLFGGADTIANELAKKLAQDIYERMYINYDLGEDMLELAIDIIFVNDRIRGRFKGIKDEEHYYAHEKLAEYNAVETKRVRK